MHLIVEMNCMTYRFSKEAILLIKWIMYLTTEIKYLYRFSKEALLLKKCIDFCKPKVKIPDLIHHLYKLVFNMSNLLSTLRLQRVYTCRWGWLLTSLNTFMKKYKLTKMWHTYVLDMASMFLWTAWWSTAVKSL